MKLVRKIPWNNTQYRCARCGGQHATWWKTVRAPSCTDRRDA